MGALSYSDDIAIAKIVFYIPAICASVYLCARHGFMKSSGWLFLTIFCLLRIVGSSAQLAAISGSSSTAVTIALICLAMGTSPLLLASLGLLSRIYYSILGQTWSLLFQFGVLKIVQTPAAVALILCIVGAVSAKSPTEIDSEPTLKAGIILFLVVYVMLLIMTLVAMIYWKKVPQSERVLIGAVVAALPFLFVHILYSFVACFSGIAGFQLATGSPTIALTMSSLEEVAVVIIYIYAGFRVQSTPLKDATATQTLGYRLGRGDFGSGRLGKLSLIFGVANAFQSRNDTDAIDEEGGWDQAAPRRQRRQEFRR